MRRPRFDRQLAAQMTAVAATSSLVIGTAGRLYQWNSDDVALQVAMRTWSPGHGTLYLPEATWVLKAPFYAVTEWLFGSQASTLLIEAMVLNVVSALMVFWLIRMIIIRVAALADSSRSMATHGWTAALVTGWLVSLSPVLVDTSLRPTNRSLEIGLICMGLVLTTNRISEVASEPTRQAIGRLVVPALWWGILAVDDPAAMYSIVAPVALVAVVVLAIRRSRMATNVLVLAVASIVLWRVGLMFLHVLGVRAVSLNPRIIRPAELPTTLANTAESLAIVFDIPVFGARPQDLRLKIVLPQIFFIALAVIAFVRHRASLRLSPLVIGSAMWAFGLLASYGLSSHGLDMANIRYIVFGAIPLTALLAAGLAASDRRPRDVMMVLLAVVLALHMFDSVRSTRTDASPNSESARLVEALSAADIQRGYGDFWETLAPSYFDDSLTLVPVTCVEGETAFRRWFVDDEIARVQPNVERTAYIHNERPGLLACPIGLVYEQFGEPVEQISVTATITLLIYDGDIGEKFAPSPTPG